MAYFMKRAENLDQYDPGRAEEPGFARSLDGGRTWQIEALPSIPPPEQGGREPLDLIEPMDFTHPDFAVTIRLRSTTKGAARLWFSLDRGRTWKSPFRFLSLGRWTSPQGLITSSTAGVASSRF